jgi:glycosyltransferase involved in cell wall biosynthesis
LSGGWLDVKGRRVCPKSGKASGARFHQAQLSIIGSGCPPEMVEADFEMELKGSVHLVPRVEDEQEMAGQYLSHSVFLMPSLQEGSPLSLLEAMASGLAVVASRVGGIPEIVTMEKTVYCLTQWTSKAPWRAFAWCFRSPRLPQRLGQRAMETARRLSWQAIRRDDGRRHTGGTRQV